MRSVTAALAAAKNAIESSDSWIWLLEVTLPGLPDPMRLARSTENVTFAGQPYQAFAFDVGEMRQDDSGNLASLDVTVMDFADEVRQVLADFDLDGTTVVLKLVHSANLASSTASIDLEFHVLGWRQKDRAITFRLGYPDFLGLKVPARRFLRNRCQWVYRGAECGYTGTLATCDRTLEGPDGCRAHNNVPRFGGAPAIPRGRE